mmetsp:Transcript_87279/g.244971  ORF Transcript_87279/g.244971 Transcript_87279/m.244971 type:complete len:250 (+) Transcript_87279:879-1628(+)
MCLVANRSYGLTSERPKLFLRRAICHFPLQLSQLRRHRLRLLKQRRNGLTNNGFEDLLQDVVGHLRLQLLAQLSHGCVRLLAQRCCCFTGKRLEPMHPRAVGDICLQLFAQLCRHGMNLLAHRGNHLMDERPQSLPQHIVGDLQQSIASEALELLLRAFLGKLRHQLLAELPRGLAHALLNHPLDLLWVYGTHVVRMPKRRELPNVLLYYLANSLLKQRAPRGCRRLVSMKTSTPQGEWLPDNAVPLTP